MRTCDECGRSTSDTMGFVYRGGDAYAIYYAVLHRHEDTPRLDLAIGIGTWQDGNSVADVSPYLAAWAEADEIRFGFVDPAGSAWVNARLIQNKLAACDARDDESRDAFLRVAEAVVRKDPAVASHLN